jgi:hypothetical protein
MFIFNFSPKSALNSSISGKNQLIISIFISGISNFSTSSSLVFSSKHIILCDFFKFFHIKNKYLYFSKYDEKFI